MNEIADSVHVLEREQAQDERGRMWVSVDPFAADSTRLDATEWAVFLKLTRGELRLTLDMFTCSTTHEGGGALPEIADDLWARGYLCQGWQLGTGNGYVSWIADMKGSEQ